jgi:hypothetical protein
MFPRTRAQVPFGLQRCHPSNNTETDHRLFSMKPIRLFSASFWKSLPGHLGAGRSSRDRPVADVEGLAYFLRTRASHVAQTSLYGYLRTRAGTRFPELFSDDAFVDSINIAKWHVWLACVSDLAIYAGGMMRRQVLAQGAGVAPLMAGVVNSVLQETGVPAEAGKDFESHASHVRARVAMCDWGAVSDDETAFSQSPAALVQWAPIVDELKQLDEEIVINSVRFRWQEVRRDLRRLLDAQAVLASAAPVAARENLMADRR